MKFRNDKWYYRMVNMLVAFILIPILFALVIPSILTFPIEYIIFGHDVPFTFNLIEKLLDS